MPPKTSTDAPPRSDAYTGMLILSLLALLAGCAFLYLDWSDYPTTKAPAPPAALPKQAPTGAVPGGGAAGAAGAQGAQGAAGAAGAMGGGAAGMAGARGMMGGGMQ